MLSTTPQTGCFINIPGVSSECILDSALVQSFADNKYTIELQDDMADLEIGQDVFIYYDFKNEFVRQPARVEEITHFEMGCTCKFQFTEDAISAERRQSYRVSTVMSEIYSKIGDEDKCEVVDVSVTGFAVIASKQFKNAEVVEASIRFENEIFKGHARIQSIHELSTNRIRYGLHCIVNKEVEETLLKGLQQICTTIQRQHLRRLSLAG